MGKTKDMLIQQNDEGQQLPVSLDKNSIFQKVKHIQNAVLGGEINALEAFVYLKWIEQIADKAKAQIIDLSLEEAEKYPEKKFKEFGCEIQVKSAAGRYDFSEIKEIEDKENELKALKEKHKQAYKSMYAATIKTQMVDEDGVVVEPAKYTPGKTTLAITF